MDVRIKIASVEDVEGIINLCNECFQENTSVLFAKEKFEEAIEDENQIYLVGIADEQIVAHTKITIIPTIFDNMKTYSILNHVCVKPEYRRHGIASKMLEECERISKERGCVKIKLWSMNFRQPAHACYNHNSYIVNDEKIFTKELD